METSRPKSPLIKEDNKLFRRFNYYLPKLSTEEIKHCLEGLDEIKVFRTVVLNEYDFIHESKFTRDKVDENERRSLRGLWYNIKGLLEKIGIIDKENYTEKVMRAKTQKLSVAVSDLIKRNLLHSYEDLKILDNSREMELVKTFEPYSNLLIAVEKNTTFQIIKDLATYFRCHALSAKGQPSFAAAEKIVDNLDFSKGVVYVYTLTDYDPSGYSIAENVIEQLKIMMRKKNIQEVPEIIHKRIGAFPYQYDEEGLQDAFSLPPKDKKSVKWFKETGGVNGEPKGLELDNLGGRRIKEIFIEELHHAIEPKQYYDFFSHNVISSVIEMAFEEILEEWNKRVLETKRSLYQKYFDKTEVRNTGKIFEKAMYENNIWELSGYFCGVPEIVENKIREEIKTEFSDLI